MGETEGHGWGCVTSVKTCGREAGGWKFRETLPDLICSCQGGFYSKNYADTGANQSYHLLYI